MCADLIEQLTHELTLLQDGFYWTCTECKNNRKIMEEYEIMEYLELTVTRSLCGQWTRKREFIWSGLINTVISVSI